MISYLVIVAVAIFALRNEFEAIVVQFSHERRIAIAREIVRQYIAFEPERNVNTKGASVWRPADPLVVLLLS